MIRIFTTLGPFIDKMVSGEIRTGAQLQERVLDSGYDGIEVHLSLLDHPRADQLLDGLDFRAVSFHSNHYEFSLGSINTYRRRGAAEQLRNEYSLAAQKGVHVLTFHPGYEGKRSTREESHDLMLRTLGGIVESQRDLIQSSNTILALENMDHKTEKLCRSEEEVAYVLSEIPELGLTCDLAHCALGGHDIMHFVERFAHRICHVHISGYKPGRSHGKVSLVQSDVDMRPFIRRLADRDLIFVIENKDLDLVDESKTVLDEIRDAS